MDTAVRQDPDRDPVSGPAAVPPPDQVDSAVVPEHPVQPVSEAEVQGRQVQPASEAETLPVVTVVVTVWELLASEMETLQVTVPAVLQDKVLVSEVARDQVVLESVVHLVIDKIYIYNNCYSTNDQYIVY